MWRLWSCPVLGDESRGHGAHGNPGAVLCQETGGGAMGHVAVPELSCARRREPGPRARGGPRAIAGPGGGSWSHEARGGSGAALCQETGATGHAGICVCLVFRLDLELVRGVSSLQGTDNKV
jgi:hypothetical protein